MTANKTHPDQADDLRKLRRTLVFVTIIPLLAFYAFILYYVPSGVLKTGWVATILIAVMLLMLAGIQMMFRLIRAVAQAAHRDGADSPDTRREQPIQGIRSIRHTVAEAAALIGAIPLLALGYLVVHYVLRARTTESVLLIACIVAAVIVLGIERINGLARRIIAVAAAARSVRMETRLPARDSGRDEIGTLSADLAQIAENLSTRASELRRTRSLVERLPHPMLVVDAAGTINYANRAALTLLNYEERELVGTRASSLFAREEEPEWILGGRGDAARENMWRRKDGTLVPVSVRIGGLSEGGGGDSVIIATDIGGRESAEEELRSSRQIIEGIIDAIPVRVFWKDRNLVFLGCNAAFARDAGFADPKEIIGKDDYQMSWRDQAELYRGDDRQVIEGGCPKLLIEEPQMTSAGNTITLLTSKIPLRSPKGEIIGVLGTYMDITERKHAKDRDCLAREILELLNHQGGETDTVRGILRSIKANTGLEAIGIRLQKGDDFPYHEASGFPEVFLQAENYLCERNGAGEIVRDAQGDPVLECMCGNILRGRTNPALPFFTKGGSFWSNCTTDLLASSTEANRPERTRNRCNGEGYESVALIPLRSGDEIIGLLQLNDHRPGCFTPEMIRYFEWLGASIGIALTRRRAEDEIKALLATVQKEKTMLAALIDSVADEIWFTDLHGKFSFMNQSALREFGIKPGETRELSDLVRGLELFRPDGSPRPVEESPPLRALSGELVRDQEEIVRTPAHAELRYRRVSSTPVREPDGSIIGAVSVVRDVTERHRAEENYRTLFREMLDGFAVHEIICDDQGRPVDYRFLSVNPAFERMTGLKEECIVGRTVLEVLPGTERRWIETCGKVALTGEPALFEDYHAELDKHFKVTAYRTAPGQFACIFADITVHTRAEAALREAEERFQQLFDHMADGVAVYQGVEEGRDFLIVDINKMGQSLSKFRLDEAVGRRVTEVFPGVERMGLLDVFRRVWRTGQPEHHPLTEYADGRIVQWVENYVYRLPSGLIVAIYSDTSEKRRAEEREREMERRLLHAQKLESLGVLAGGIAHDFNNLLTAILGNMDLALDDLSPVSPARRSIEEAVNATKRAEALTRQMLAYSGRGQFIIADLDLSELVEENAHMLRAAMSKKVTPNLNLDKGLPPIAADAGQIQQVVMNLITNASESLGEQAGIVALSTGAVECDEAYLGRSRLEEKPAPGRYVFLEVTDTGCGMDGETQGRIFDPFFTTKFTGRGLGMSAVLGIVRGHNGAIMVESEVGRGTTIRVLFPASVTAPAGKGTAKRSSRGEKRKPGPPLPTGTVLVVDDEEMVRAPCAAMVAHAGYRALTAASGDEAIALFREHAEGVVCVILDLTMPGRDGVATFEALRKIRPDVKVILSSGYNEQEATRRFSGQGLAGFVKKPYEMKTLLAELGRVTER